MAESPTDSATLPDAKEDKTSSKSAGNAKGIVHLPYEAPDVDTLDITQLSFEFISAERCAKETGGADAPETRARSVTRLVGAYIPAVDGPTYMRSGDYSAIALIAPSSLHDDGVVVGGCVFRPQAHAFRGGTCRFIELALFAVENLCQGRSLGRQLMAYLKRHAVDNYQAQSILTFADYKAFAFFKRVGYDRRIKTPAAVWRAHCVHYNGAAVCETRLEGLEEEERRRGMPPVPKACRIIPCTSGQPNCYCRSGRTRAIARYDGATGEELAVYCGAADAARKLGLAACSVTHVTNGLAESAGGHHFRYINEVAWLNSGSRAVLELARDGSVKHEHPSCNAAANRLFGKNTRKNGSIGECCNGYIDHVDGHVFRWAEPRINGCDYCGSDADAATLLLCDGIDGRCGATAHVACLGLTATPTGDHFCDRCQERLDAGWSATQPVPRKLPRGYFKDRRGVTPQPVLRARAEDAQRALDAARPTKPPPPPKPIVIEGPRRRKATKRLGEDPDEVEAPAKRRAPSAPRRPRNPTPRRPRTAIKLKAVCADAFLESGTLCDLCARPDGRMVACASCLGPRAHVACLPAPVDGPWTCGVCTGDARLEAACEPRPPPAPSPKAYVPPRDAAKTIASCVCRACKREFRSPQARAAHLGGAPACRAMLGLPPLPPSQYATAGPYRGKAAPPPAAAPRPAPAPASDSDSDGDDEPTVQHRGTRTRPPKPKRPVAVVSFEEEPSPKRRASSDPLSPAPAIAFDFAATGGTLAARPSPPSPAPAPAPSIAEIRAAYQREQAAAARPVVPPAPPSPVAWPAPSPERAAASPAPSPWASGPDVVATTYPTLPARGESPQKGPGAVESPVSPATQSLMALAAGGGAARAAAPPPPASPATKALLAHAGAAPAPAARARFPAAPAPAPAPRAPAVPAPAPAPRAPAVPAPAPAPRAPAVPAPAAPAPRPPPRAPPPRAPAVPAPAAPAPRPPPRAPPPRAPAVPAPAPRPPAPRAPPPRSAPPPRADSLQSLPPPPAASPARAQKKLSPCRPGVEGPKSIFTAPAGPRRAAPAPVPAAAVHAPPPKARKPTPAPKRRAAESSSESDADESPAQPRHDFEFDESSGDEASPPPSSPPPSPPAAASPTTDDVDALVARNAPIARTEKPRQRVKRPASVEAATTAREYLEGGGKKPDLKYDLKGGYFRVRDAAPASPAAEEAAARRSRARTPTDRFDGAPTEIPSGSPRAARKPAAAASPAAEEAPPPKKKRGRPPKSPAAADDDAAPKKGAARRSPPPARKPAAATPRSPPKPKQGAPASPRPSDVPNGSLKYNQENPKKKGSKSWHRYESYKKATTVDEYFRRQGTIGDLKYDFSRGFFKAPPAVARWCASK